MRGSANGCSTFDLDPGGPVASGWSSTRGFVSGEAVYRIGGSANRLYVMATGSVNVAPSNVDGRESLLDVLGPADFLGALPALGQQQYSETVWALTPVCMLELDADEFAAIMEQFPAVVLAALKTVSRRLTESQETAHLCHAAARPRGERASSADRPQVTASAVTRVRSIAEPRFSQASCQSRTRRYAAVVTGLPAIDTT